MITTIPGNDVEVGEPCSNCDDLYKDHLAAALSTKVEACSTPDSFLPFTCINSLVESANIAYSHHYGLYLSPDIIWLTLIQGLSRHINLNAEKFRSQFVSFEGKQLIVVQRDNFVKGGENPWENVFPEYASAIREYIGEENHDLIVSNWSTTDEIARVASQIVLMEAMQNYFEYGMVTACGIPYYEIDGTEEDWGNMLERVSQWDRFGLDWWLPEAKSLLQKFVDAKKGSDEPWTSFFKRDGMSGGPYIGGDILKLFPYAYAKRSPNWYAMHYGGGQYKTNNFPNSYSKAPFWWQYYSERYEMGYIGGILGMTRRDSVIVPHIGWAVEEVC